MCFWRDSIFFRKKIQQTYCTSNKKTNHYCRLYFQGVFFRFCSVCFFMNVNEVQLAINVTMNAPPYYHYRTAPHNHYETCPVFVPNFPLNSVHREMCPVNRVFGSISPGISRRCRLPRAPSPIPRLLRATAHIHHCD